MVPLAGLVVQVEQNCYGVGGQDTGRDHRVTEGCHRRRERREGARHRRDGEHAHTHEADALNDEGSASWREVAIPRIRPLDSGGGWFNSGLSQWMTMTVCGSTGPGEPARACGRGPLR